MKENNIRKRRSYGMFQELLEFLNGTPTTRAVLERVYELLDEKRGFGSERNSQCALESLNLLVKDKRVI